MRAMLFLAGFVMLFIFWPATIVMWMFCLVPSARRDHVGDIKTVLGHRMILREDGRWHVL